MKSISDTLKRLSDTSIEELASLLECKKATQREVSRALIDPLCMHGLLASLHRDEVRILELIYSGNDGITYGEAEKELNIPVAKIETHATMLSRRSLIYVMKNRQLLNNKMDKMYTLQELTPLLRFYTADMLKEYLAAASASLNSGEKEKVTLPGDDKTGKFLKAIAHQGGILSVADTADHLPASSRDKIIYQLLQDEILELVHCQLKDFQSLLLLKTEYLPFFTDKLGRGSLKKTINVRNHYTFLHNILITFDTISTYGLFLTKQEQFRKIDKRRITDALLPLYDMHGEPADEEMITDLMLFLLHKMGCLTMKKDIASVSLKPIKKEVESPVRFLNRALRSLEGEPGNPDSAYFPLPFQLKGTKDLFALFKQIVTLDSPTLPRIEALYIAGVLSSSIRKSATSSIFSQSSEHLATLNTLISLLLLTGLIDITEGCFTISDTGADMAPQLIKQKVKGPEPGDPVVYINPDFSLLIPSSEMPSESLYHLLTHVEILKNEIVIEGRITKGSIVRAHKRGMTLKYFLETLERFARNELPQNLSFLVREWSNQTVRVTVDGVFLLAVSHSSFLDELIYGKMSDVVISRLSDTHAIIDREHLDDVIRHAKKEDAVISLFENTETFD